MPSYTYRCSKCKQVLVLSNIPVEQRDQQQCGCGRILTRVTAADIASSTINIPAPMRSDWEPITPTDPVQAAQWEKEGVRPVGRRWV